MKKKKKSHAARKVDLKPQKKTLSKEDRLSLAIVLGILGVFLATALIILIVHLSGDDAAAGTGESSSATEEVHLDFVVGDFGYTIKSQNTVEVYHYKGKWDTIVIPDAVIHNGTTYHVVSISSYGILAESAISETFSITIPESIVSIGDLGIAYRTENNISIYPTVIFGGTEAEWNMIYMNPDMQLWLSDETVFIFGE